MAEVFLTQPLQIVAGSEAGSKWMSDELLKRAASKDKKMHVVQGSNRMKLYDVAQICRRSGFSSRIILREDTRARKNDKGQGRLSSSFIDSSSPNGAINLAAGTPGRRRRPTRALRRAARAPNAGRRRGERGDRQAMGRRSLFSWFAASDPCSVL